VCDATVTNHIKDKESGKCDSILRFTNRINEIVYGTFLFRIAKSPLFKSQKIETPPYYSIDREFYNSQEIPKSEQETTHKS